MKLGFVSPSYPNEKRVALLPCDIGDFKDEIVVESGFGRSLGISDSCYVQKGCTIAAREDVFRMCDTIFALKLLQPVDYDYIRPGQMIVGWTHPNGSGSAFMAAQARPKKLKIVDLDIVGPKMYYEGSVFDLDFLPANFLHKNSFYAGFSSSMHAFLNYGAYPDPSMKIAILGSGNTAQGIFHFLSKFTDNIRMFYRRTMEEFKSSIGSYDVIANGIEVDIPGYHLITKEELQKTKPGCLIIDAAADAGNTIEGTRFTTHDKPIYEEGGRWFYCINNSPTLIYRTTSRFLSEAFSENVFRGGVERFWNLVNK